MSKRIIERVGEEQTALNGQKMTIIIYRSNSNLDVKFEDGTIVKHKQYIDFKRGKIRNPNKSSYSKRHQTKIGETRLNYQNMPMTITDYKNNTNVDVKFADGMVVKNKPYRAFITGRITNPNLKVYKTSKHIRKDRTGLKTKATNGQEMTIINYRGILDIDVQFEDGTIVEHKTFGNFQTGKIRNPNASGTSNIKAVKVLPYVCS